jgi:hypothetical protein
MAARPRASATTRRARRYPRVLVVATVLMAALVATYFLRLL